MSKLLRGELLVFTERGLVRLDTITKDDKILTIDNEYEDIEEISKVFKKKYKLNKIDNYYLNDNIEVKAIKNIPFDYDSKDIQNIMEDNKNKYLQKSSIGDLSEFDFLGFPLNINSNNSSNNNDYYRYQGLILTSHLKFNNDYDKSSIEFLENYVISNEIPYEIKKDTFSTTFEIINERKIRFEDIFKMNIDELNEFIKGIIENSNEFFVIDNEIFKIIKFTCLFLGINMTSYFKDGRINIKILKEDKNKFIYDNFIWNKIKYIKKVEFTGNLYSLSLKSKKFYLTEFGLIS
jgi:uncharacterized protein YqfB (UPF0267 family)